MMDAETQALIDQLRDKMAGMSPDYMAQVVMKLLDGHFDVVANFKPVSSTPVSLKFRNFIATPND